MSSTPEEPAAVRSEFISTDELIRRHGIKPVTSLDDLAQPDLFESDEEYEDFLSDLYASRRADIA